MRISSKNVVVILASAALLFFSSCAGGGSRGTGGAYISGKIVSSNNTPLEGVIVSIGSQGAVAISDSTGKYSLLLENRASSLEVVFSAGQVVDALTIDDLPQDVGSITVDVVFDLSVGSGDNITDSVVKITDIETQLAACDVIDRVNISILGTNSFIIVPDDFEVCFARRGLGQLLLLGNPGQLGFEYVITAEPDYFMFETSETGLLDPGEALGIAVEYDCSKALAELAVGQSVDSIIEVNITGIIVEDGSLKDAEELVSECGITSSVGNLSESTSITSSVQDVD